MKADLVGALARVDKIWKMFEHNGKPMSKPDVIKVLKHGIKKGYETTADFTDTEIDELLNPQTQTK